MENNELNERVLKNVKNRIVISNLEREEKMRLDKKKQVLSLVTVLVLFISGGFFTVNASTDGQLANNIKDTIKVIFIKNDGTEQDIEGKTSTNSKGDTLETYEQNTENGKMITEINKSELDKQNMKIDEKITENKIDNTTEIEATIELKK